MVRRVNGRLRQLSLLALAAVAITGCVPPRATWARDTGTAPAATAAGAGSASAGAERKAPVSTTGGGGHGSDGLVHVVQRGENLYRIALHYGLSADEVADANEITDPTQLAVGRELVIPQRKGSAAAAPGRTTSRPKVRPSVSRREPARGKRENAILGWPVQGVLYSRFGPRGATRHDGIDIAAPEGTKIVAAADGVVLFAGTQRGYGNIVILRHQGDLITIYAHNQRNLVQEGAEVKAGQPLALVGRTGRATGPHCHFEVRRGTEPHDPLDFLP
ncbi:M23 family metallopeptidase [Vulgatibacter sp.]|uniref:M23 family metallopeptidase n=1 Tax=Vulgatibacter sp. TaxID=1971226 RepID=UPI00356B5A17